MIYIVEDDSSISELEVYALRNAGFEAAAFESGADFRAALRTVLPELVILDWMLPGESGIEILKMLRAQEATAALPVLLVTAKDTELDVVKGLDAGADDFLTKPFGLMEFTSRVRALLRRAARQNQTGDLLRYGPIAMTLSGHTVTVEGKNVELTFKEYAILELLLKDAGKVVPRERIWTKVWDTAVELESRTFDMHMRTLRQKLGEAGSYIQTVRKVGYKLEKPDENEIG